LRDFTEAGMLIVVTIKRRQRPASQPEWSPHFNVVKPTQME